MSLHSRLDPDQLKQLIREVPEPCVGLSSLEEYTKSGTDGAKILLVSTLIPEPLPASCITVFAQERENQYWKVRLTDPYSVPCAGEDHEED